MDYHADNRRSVWSECDRLGSMEIVYTDLRASRFRRSIMDSIVTAVIQKFKQRSEFGKAKYGTDLDRTDLSVLQWIVHAQEEHMDAILYLEKLKQTLFGKPPA